VAQRNLIIGSWHLLFTIKKTNLHSKEWPGPVGQFLPIMFQLPFLQFIIIIVITLFLQNIFTEHLDNAELYDCTEHC
jgi:hypothetical protein